MNPKFLQHRAQDEAVHRDIIDNQNLKRCQRLFEGIIKGDRGDLDGGLVDMRQRQHQTETCAFVRRAFQLDAAAHLQGQTVRDGQAEPAALAMFVMRSHLHKVAEQLALVFDTDAQSGIAHADFGQRLAGRA